LMKIKSLQPIHGGHRPPSLPPSFDYWNEN
jgi:hypothetical protein